MVISSAILNPSKLNHELIKTPNPEKHVLPASFAGLFSRLSKKWKKWKKSEKKWKIFSFLKKKIKKIKKIKNKKK